MWFIPVLAVFGGITIVFYLLKFTWKCWDGFKEFVLSEHWQVDLKKYGGWAGKAEETLLSVCFWELYDK